MKINWFCPLPPEKTDIAHYTNRILKSLAEQADITLWTDKPNWLSELEQYAVVRHYHPDNLSESELQNADVNIYNTGNNNDFHGSIYKVSRKFPGIVVIHDVNLHYLFTCLYSQYLKEGTSDYDAYLNLMKRCHGDFCQQDLNKFFAGNLDWSTISERYPLTFGVTDNALGIVTHTQDAYSIFSKDRRCNSPVLYSPLPYPSAPIKYFSRDETITRPPYRLIAFGYLGGFYRRIQSVLEALGTMPEKDAFLFDIYGQIWDEDYIQGLITKYNLEAIVSLHGYVEEAVLDRALANADLAFNLRYPTGGEASGSQMRIWSHGLASLVTRVGWYADLPEDSVVFVNQEQEIEDIQQHLRDLLKNPGKFAEIGKKGQQVLATQHNPDDYAVKIVDFAKEITQPHYSFIAPIPPKVSVIIPTYNNANSIERAIDSILEQTYTDYEIIVVDDGSTDNTQQILKPYRDRRQIRYSMFQHNQGGAIARNRGVEMARGKLITFLDGDDWYLPNKLEAQVSYLHTHTDVSAVNSGFYIVGKEGEILREIQHWHQYPTLNLESWVFLKPILLSTMMFRRDWLEWVGQFDTNFPYGDKVNLVFRLSNIGCNFGWLKQATVYCNQLGNSVCQHAPKKSKSVLTAFENLFAQSNLPSSIKSIQKQFWYQTYLYFAWISFVNNNTQEEVDYLTKSISYTDLSHEEIIDDWINQFNIFSDNFGCDFDTYQFSDRPEWIKLVPSLLT